MASASIFKKCYASSLLILLVFAGCKAAENTSIKTTTAQKVDTYQVITGFELTEYFSGKKKIEIKAKEASIKPKMIAFFKTPLVKEAHMTKPEIAYFRKGEETSCIKADSGKMNMSNKGIVLKDNVSVVTADGKMLSAKRMTLYPKTGVLSIRGRFTLSINGNATKGRGLKSDIELKEPAIRYLYKN